MENATPITDHNQNEQTAQSKKPANKSLGVILGVFVVALIAIGAFAISQMYQRSATPAPQQTSAPTVAPTPDEEQEASAVDTNDVEQDLQDVQKDVDAL